MLKSTGSEFHGFPRDRYTTLQETDDRILATSVTAWWRYADGVDLGALDFNALYDGIRDTLLATFATVHSLALQQTIFEVGKAILETYDEVAEVKLSCPNKHHFLVDLAPFGLENPNEVFFAADRPYGLIQATIQREGAAPSAAGLGNGARVLLNDPSCCSRPSPGGHHDRHQQRHRSTRQGASRGRDAPRPAAVRLRDPAHPLHVRRRHRGAVHHRRRRPAWTAPTWRCWCRARCSSAASRPSCRPWACRSSAPSSPWSRASRSPRSRRWSPSSPGSRAESADCASSSAR